MTNIGINIKKLRSVKGLSQQAFADLFNLTRGNISSYEEFRAEPRIAVILQIAKYFGMPVSSLLEKKLTVNEILNFEDHFQEESNANDQQHMKLVYFLDKSTWHLQDLNFDLSSLPQFYFPIIHKGHILAIENSALIPHPSDFPFSEHSLLFFERVQLESLHTLDQNLGFYAQEKELFFGRFEVKEKQIDLILNDWKKVSYHPDFQNCFWKLFGTFEKNN